MTQSILHFHISALVTAIINVALVLFILIRAPSAVLKIRFVWYGSAITFWSFFLWLFSTVNNQTASFLFCQLLHVGAIFIPCFFLHFVIAYLNLASSIAKIILKLSYVASSFFLVIDIFFPRLLISDVTPKLGFPYFMNAGIFYHAWTALFFTIVVIGHVFLIRATFKPNGKLKAQHKFFLTGNALGYLGGIGVFLPVYDITIFPFPYGAYGVVLFSLVTAFTILRYKFLDIEVIVKKTLVFGGLSAFVFACFSIPLLLLPTFYPASMTSKLQLWFLIFAGMAVAGLVGPLNQLLINATDKYLFQKKYDYRKLLKEASEKMAKLKSLKQLSRLIVSFLFIKGRISKVATYIRNDDENSDFVLQAVTPRIETVPIKLHYDSPIICYLEKKRKALEKNELEAELAECPIEERMELQTLVELLGGIKVEVIIPSYSRPRKSSNDSSMPQLRSVLLLGSKKSDEPYNQEDLDVFFTLAQEAAIAIENSRLYDEGIQKTKENVELKLQLVRKQTLANLTGSIAHEVKGPIQLIYFAARSIKNLYPKISQLLDDSLELETRKNLLKEVLDILPKNVYRIEEQNEQQLTTTTTIEYSAKIDDLDFENLSEEELEELDKIEKHKIDVYMFLKLAIEKSNIQCQGRGDYTVEMDTTRLTSHIPPIKMNQGLLQQVMTNLILNAYDAVKGRGAKKISFAVYIDRENPEFMHIEIEDTGPGISPEMQKKIWDSGVSTKGDKGTGMGLYWCKFIMERIHPGQISLVSTLGVGTTFHLKIPIWNENQKPPDQNK